MTLTNPQEVLCGDFDSYEENYNSDDEERRQYKIDSITAGQSVYASMRDQLDTLLPPDTNTPLYRGCHTALDYIDNNGYLAVAEADNTNTDECAATIEQEIAEKAGISLEEAQEAIQFIQQNAEPAGIGARDLRECLMLQLERQGKKNSLAWKMLANCFEEMKQRLFQKIADKLDVDVEDVQKAMQYLSTLDMAPGASLDTQQSPVYFQPEVQVVRMPDKQLKALPLDGVIPEIGIDESYIKQLEKRQGGKLSQDVTEKIKAYKQDIEQLQNDLEFRNSTVVKVAQALVDRQPEYFSNNGKVAPLLQKDLATELNLANSTICRTIQDKYMLLPSGRCIPFSTLVERQAGENGCTKKDIQDKIQDLLSQGRLSDQKITNCLQQQGIKISRRAVNKYRRLLKIAASSPHKRKAKSI